MEYCDGLTSPTSAEERFVVRDVTALTDEAVFQRLLGTVSVERQERALKYRFPMGRALSLGAALALDELLQQRGLRERDQQYVIGEHGKPSLKDHPELHFSISHSGHQVAVAIGESELGIDIQQWVRKLSDGLVRKVCSEEEQRLLEADEDRRTLLFTRLWVLKESYVKAVGTGITDDFPAFDLSGSEPRLLNRITPCSFHEFETEEGRGAVCLVHSSQFIVHSSQFIVLSS